MSKVSVINNSLAARPFSWLSSTGPTWSTNIVAPSNGKYKEAPNAVFQAMVAGTSGTQTATVAIQGTMDDMTGAGVNLQVVLTNGSTTVTFPKIPYTVVTLVNNQPTTTTVFQEALPGSFLAVPVDISYSTTFMNYPGFPLGSSGGQVSSATVAITSGMNVYGPGLGAGTTVASSPTITTVTLTAAPSGLPVSPGVYEVNFTNNFWASTAIGTITLSGTLNASDGFTTNSAWKYVRANVTALSGTGAVCYAVMGT